MNVAITRHPILSVVYAGLLLGSVIGGLTRIVRFYTQEKESQDHMALAYYRVGRRRLNFGHLTGFADFRKSSRSFTRVLE
jgi:hypothetical protein